ncbi:Calpain-5 [Hypsibius exemplaris]|uniref:Calpain-5 n=1 Tax=Hypsibius exemplaris TaxID=2072580 RepID=A0A9X6NMM7_HYPEX|nr:Calpain-5 [Hypsibius exemplaris]
MPMDFLNKLGIRPPALNVRTLTGMGRDLGLINQQGATHRNQNYAGLKAACLQSGTLFEDDQFPCQATSLFYTNTHDIPLNAVRWLRPKEINPNGRLVRTGGTSPDGKDSQLGRDVSQGQIGNCWFVAACAVLAEFPKLWKHVIPDFKEQELDGGTGKGYAGIFHFKFWVFGEWLDVVIDDRLPTVNGQLIFCKSKAGDEFWGPLLEKAYAKLNGCYEALDGGNLTDALIDFTGGAAETSELSDVRRNPEKQTQLYNLLATELKFNGLICAAIAIQSKAEMEAVQQNGLVKGHAYGVTNIKTIQNNDVPALLSFLGMGNNTAVRLIRVRNPWGKKEWTGRFSDGSGEWNQISQAKRQELGLVFEDDGEFWMAFDDFCEHFSSVSVCRVIYNSFIGTILSGGAKNWSEGVFKGAWSRPDKVGGCVNNRDSFFQNPQYRFDVLTDDEQVMVALSQPDNRSLRAHGGAKYLAIGFYIMRIEINRKTRVRIFKDKAGSSAYTDSRTVTLRTTLKPGRYCVIPTTFEPNQEGQFLLRVFTSNDCKAGELEADVPKKKILGGLMSGGSIDAEFLTTVCVRQVNGLSESLKRTLPDPFVQIECEGKTAKTPVIPNSVDAVFNETALFYRKNLNSPIKIQVFNHNLIKDTILGECTVDGSQLTNGQTLQHQCPLKASNGSPAGILIVDVATYNDLTAV